MMDAFTATLEACDPDRNHFRAYRIEAGTDLLGDWLVEVTYGRIGSPGRNRPLPENDACRGTRHAGHRVVQACMKSPAWQDWWAVVI